MTDTVEHPNVVKGVVLRFAGDSGDGMQLAGERFTSMSAAFGNDLSTFPDFPAEIRAPAGTLAGVSSFQVQISDHAITTPGDTPNVLVAMNPAGLKANVALLEAGATVIVNADAFDERSLEKAGYTVNPLEDGSLGQLHGLRGPDDRASPRRRARRRGSSPATRSARRTSSRSGSCRGCTRARTRQTVVMDRARASPRSPSCQRRTSARSARDTTSARPPSCSTRATRSQAAPFARGGVRQRHRATPRSPGG